MKDNKALNVAFNLIAAAIMTAFMVASTASAGVIQITFNGTVSNSFDQESVEFHGCLTRISVIT